MSKGFYAAMADRYDEEFLAPHREMYDRLAWEAVTSLYAEHSDPLNIVDVGCGTGRWSRLLVDAGHSVIGIEPCAEMAAATSSLDPSRFSLQTCGVDDAAVESGWADLVVCMGSVQYATKPAESIRRAAGWLRPDGMAAVLVDSLGGLVLELLARGDDRQAIERAATRRASWSRNGVGVEYHLLDASSLESAAADAGLVDVTVSGLLVGHAVTIGRDVVAASPIDVERELAAIRPLADSAKQLLMIGRRGHA